MVDKCSSCSKMTVFETLVFRAPSEMTWFLRSKFFVVCKCPGERATINCQIPALRDSFCIKLPGFARGPAVRGWNWLAHIMRAVKRGWESLRIDKLDHEKKEASMVVQRRTSSSLRENIHLTKDRDILRNSQSGWIFQVTAIIRLPRPTSFKFLLNS